MTEITETVARKVLTTIDAGLIEGVGQPIPGQMCVMAAINYAMGHEHGDKPSCVHPIVRDFDIRLNDSRWSSKEARAKGMRREAIAKLGSTKIDAIQFAKLVAFGSMTRILPKVLRFAASKGKGGEGDAALEAAAVELENAKDHAAAVQATRKASRATAKARSDTYAYADAYADAYAYASADAYAYASADAYADAYASADAYAYAYASADAYAYAYAAFRDEVLSLSADIACDALIACGSEGAQYLWLCDEVTA